MHTTPHNASGFQGTPGRAGEPATLPAVVLHVRVLTGSGGGPEKTILHAPRHAYPSQVRMVSAFIHPRDDPGIDLIRQKARVLGCPLHTIGESGPLDSSTLRRLHKLCRDLSVQIWHGHDYKSNMLGFLVRCLWPMKLATTVHGWTWDTLRSHIYYHLDNWCLKRYDRVVVVSPLLLEHCERLGIGLDRLEYVPNGVDTEACVPITDIERREARRRLKVPLDRPVLGVVGRLSVEKGVDRALRLVRQLRDHVPNVQLQVVGDGPHRQSLERLTGELDLEHTVKFCGWREQIRPFLSTMDALLLPSHTEGSPNVVLEAMAAATPVAATDVGNVRELLDGGRCGLLLGQDPADWHTPVASLLADKQRRDALATNARHRVETHYSFKQRMARVLAIYDQLLDKRSLTGPMRRAA